MRKTYRNLICTSAAIVICTIISGSCTKKDDSGDPDPTHGAITDKDGNVYHSVTSY